LSDIAEVQTAEGKIHLLVGIDRISTFSGTPPLGKADYKVAIISQFAEQRRNRNTVYSGQMRFDMICEGAELSAIDPGAITRGTLHHRTKPNPWTNGEADRMNRRGKEGTVK